MDAARRRCFPGEYTSEPSARWLGNQCAVCDGCVLFTLLGIVLANEQVPGDCDDEGTLFSLGNSNIRYEPLVALQLIYQLHLIEHARIQYLR